MIDERSNARMIELFDELLGSSRAEYAGEILRRTGAMRQRPTWMFPTRWLPAVRLPRSDWLTPLPARSVAAIFVLLAVLALAMAAFVASRPRLPTPFGPAGNGRIAYASAGEIWVADSTENSARILIGGPESDNIPIWSPLGDRLAFLRHPDPRGTVGDFHLMVADADGSEVLQLSGPLSGLNGIAWSPNQSAIAFGHSVGSASAIVLYHVAGGAPTELKLSVPAEWPAWRPPDGAQIAFLGLREGQWTLHIARSDGSEVRDTGIVAGPPSWSPDGSRLLFDRAAGIDQPGEPRARLHVARVDASGALIDDRPLEFDARNDKEMGGVWSPDGQRIAFLRARDGLFRIAIGNPDGTGYVEIGQETGPPDADVNSVWMWSPDGRWLFQTFDDAATWILDPEGGLPRKAAIGIGAFTNWQRVGP